MGDEVAIEPTKRRPSLPLSDSAGLLGRGLNEGGDSGRSGTKVKSSTMLFRSIFLTSILVAVFAVTACSHKSKEGVVSNPGVSNILQNFVDSFNGRNAARLSGLFASNALIYGLTGNQPLRGKDEVQVFFSNYFSVRPDFQMTLTNPEVLKLRRGYQVVAGQLAMRKPPAEAVVKNLKISASVKPDPETKNPLFFNVKVYGYLP